MSGPQQQDQQPQVGQARSLASSILGGFGVGGVTISNNEKQFILEALREGKKNSGGKAKGGVNPRIDGRGFYDFRSIRITFGSTYGHAEVQLGRTRVVGIVSSSIVEPYPERPTEGFLTFNTELSPMADLQFSKAKQSELSLEISKVIERGLKGSRAIDTEALCIISGQKVWSLRVDLHVVDHYGNLMDCAHIAAISALLHFRRPEVTISGEEVVVHSVEDREPVPLSIHHIPICVTFAFYDDGDIVIVDPSLKEEQVMEGVMTLAQNVHNEVCALQKGGGIPITTDQILRCLKIASVKASEITQLIKSSLEKDAEFKRIQKLPAYAREKIEYLKKQQEERQMTEDGKANKQQQAAKKTEAKKEEEEVVEDDDESDLSSLSSLSEDEDDGRMADVDEEGAAANESDSEDEAGASSKSSITTPVQPSAAKQSAEQFLSKLNLQDASALFRGGASQWNNKAGEKQSSSVKKGLDISSDEEEAGDEEEEDGDNDKNNESSDEEEGTSGFRKQAMAEFNAKAAELMKQTPSFAKKATTTTTATTTRTAATAPKKDLSAAIKRKK